MSTYRAADAPDEQPAQRVNTWTKDYGPGCRQADHAGCLPWIVTGYLLTATAMAPLYGKISDVHGRRPTVYAAILIFLAGSLVSAMAPNMLVLVVGRAIQGAGGGGLFALAQ